MKFTRSDQTQRRIQARYFIEDLLTHKLDVGNFQSVAGDLDWHEVLTLSGDQLVTPSLFVALRRSQLLDYIPQDPQEALLWIYEANEARNGQLLRAWKDLACILVKAGVVCLPLKGIALLAHGLCHENDRVLADIDFLVKPSQLPKALRALSEAGYRQISNVNDPATISSELQFNPLDPNDFRNQVQPVGYQLPAILPPDEEIVMELHYRIGDSDHGIADYIQPLVDKLFAEGRQGQRSETLDRFLIVHTFYHSHIKDEAHTTGTMDLRHLMDIERLLVAGADVEGALHDLRQHLSDGKYRAALASFAHVCAEIWPENISVWKDIDSVEQAGLRYYDGVRTQPFRARLAWRLAKLRRSSRFVFGRGWLKTLYGDRSAAVLLLRLLRYSFIRALQRVRRTRQR
ncbi:MAG: nucleotidyltransferase family protein [Granulosicoccus sp.]